MTSEQFKNRIESLVSAVYFSYKENDCIIDPISHSKYIMVYGENEITAGSIDEVMNSGFYGGKSLTEIFADITDLEW